MRYSFHILYQLSQSYCSLDTWSIHQLNPVPSFIIPFQNSLNHAVLEQFNRPQKKIIRLSSIPDILFPNLWVLTNAIHKLQLLGFPIRHCWGFRKLCAYIMALVCSILLSLLGKHSFESKKCSQHTHFETHSCSPLASA